MSDQKRAEETTELEELNDDGAGLGAQDEPNTFEPEEDPAAVESPETD